MKVVDVNGLVNELDWSPDGTKIAFLAQPCSLVPVDPDPSLDCEHGFGGPGPEFYPNVYVVTLGTGAVAHATLDRRGGRVWRGRPTAGGWPQPSTRDQAGTPP